MVLGSGELSISPTPKDGNITAAENSQDHHFSLRSQSQSSQHDVLSGDPDAMGSDEEGM
jgi:hypothetical protein